MTHLSRLRRLMMEAPIEVNLRGVDRFHAPLPKSLRGSYNFLMPDTTTSTALRHGKYSRVTRDIEITVLPEFVPDRSDMDKGQYFWAYTVEIANRGNSDIQLTHRYWRITDANGRVEEVRGPGVVGKQPVLRPGEMFRYTSGCPLSTPSGFMVGTYRIVEVGGGVFDAEIPMFSLDAPAQRRVLN